MRSRSCAVKDATAWSACRFVDALCQMGASALDSLDSLARGGKLRRNANDRVAAQHVGVLVSSKGPREEHCPHSQGMIRPKEEATGANCDFFVLFLRAALRCTVHSWSSSSISMSPSDDLDGQLQLLGAIAQSVKVELAEVVTGIVLQPRADI